ncbi:MAG: carboxypeptidase-like regulatory domain-containing protein [Kofleriaceae bacterium]
MRACFAIAACLVIGCAASRSATKGDGAKLVARCNPSLESPALSGDPGCVRGEVTDAKTGKKLGGATVTASRQGEDAVFTTLSDATGTYSIQLPEGTYTIGVFTADREFERKGVEVRANEAVQVLVKLPKAGSEMLILQRS